MLQIEFINENNMIILIISYYVTVDVSSIDNDNDYDGVNIKYYFIIDSIVNNNNDSTDNNVGILIIVVTFIKIPEIIFMVQQC